MDRTDVLGRALRTLDADRGELDVRYNAFDEVVWMRDAEGTETHIAYDGLGRMTSRTDGT